MRRRNNSVADTLVELGFGPERKCPTMVELQQMTGLQDYTVWGWLAGERWPRLDNAMALATVLNVGLGALATAIRNAHERRRKAEEVQALLHG
jgi:transcriptional regulator with XRE-family HTH domain